jgi:hypothetical protein
MKSTCATAPRSKQKAFLPDTCARLLIQRTNACVPPENRRCFSLGKTIAIIMALLGMPIRKWRDSHTWRVGARKKGLGLIIRAGIISN